MPLSSNNGTGHERRCLVVPASHLLDDVFVQHHAITADHQRAKTNVDLALTSRTDLDAGLDHGHHHLGTEILKGVVGRDREVPALVVQLVAEVRILLGAAVPASFDRVMW